MLGFTPDVKLWVVEFTKSDEFKQVNLFFFFHKISLNYVPDPNSLY